MNPVLFLLGALLLTAAPNTQALEAVVDCGDPFNTPGRVGPWSYTDPESWRAGSAGGGNSASRIRIVEGRHFTDSVKKLERGSTAVEPLPDIAYTLEVIPDNHHALFAVTRLYRKTNGTMLVYPQTNRTQYQPRQLHAPCWFDRARRFAPKDPAVHMLSGIFHHQIEEYPEAIEFYQRVFGASERMRLAMPDGTIGHAELEFGDSVVMLAEENPDWAAVGPLTLGGSPTSVLLYVEDVDALYQQAVDAGVKVIQPLKDQFYGDRSCHIEDPFGHRWSIASHVEDVPQEEIAERMKTAMGPEGCGES